MIADQKSSVDEISSSVTSTYQVEVADGKLMTDAVSALAETLLRVPKEKRDQAISKDKHNTPESLYLWAIANATIVFPYLTLKSATEHMKHSVYAPRSWGYVNDKFRLPKPESTADSNAWQLLREIILAKLGPSSVDLDADVNETVPDLSSDVCAKEPLIETVLIRLMELARNPLSATIRRTELEKAETNIKNAVDFIILEAIYQREEIYKNLTLSGPAVSSGRRARRVESKGAGNKVTYTTVYVGLKLAEMLCKYLPKVTAKSPEGEPFVQTIVSFLHKLIPDELGDYRIPKSFFETPSNQLRALIREGPKIKTKKGERHNLYVPFSFVKSSECASYPEVARKRIIQVGTDVLLTLDEVNKMPLDRCNQLVPILKDYLLYTYAISDKSRKMWRQNLMVPVISELESLVIKDFPDISHLTNGAYSYTVEEIEEELAELQSRGDSLAFYEAYVDPETKAKELAKVQDIIATKKANRPRR
jgi:hypothetical protein